MQLDTPLLAAKRLENARGFIEQEEWDAAVTALAELAEEFPEALIRISQGRYLNVADAARLFTLQLPAAGLEAYRRRVDGWSRQQFAAATLARDDRALRRLLTGAYASEFGDDALDTLAEWAWEDGDANAARHLWTQLIPLDPSVNDLLLLRYPDTDRDLAAVHAKLILCSLAEGNLGRAADELAAFVDMFPDASGTLAGREGRYSDILESLVNDVSAWDRSVESARWSTFARNPARNAAENRPVTLGRPWWTVPLRPVYVPRWKHPRPALPERGLLARYPVTFGAGVFFHDGTTVHGLRLENGKPLWPLENEAAADETPGQVYPTLLRTIPRALPWTPIVGVPRFTATVHEGRLYALLGPSVLTLPPKGRQVSPTTLVSLNLAHRQGLLEWLRTPENLFADGWMVTGTPVAHGGNLYVTLLKSEPQIEVAVACLRAEDGSPLWQTTVGQALREPLGGRIELGHLLLTLTDDRLYLATDFGAVAAMETRTGRIAWVVTYSAFEHPAIDRSNESGMGLLPPIFHEGTLFVKPNDGDELLAIDAETGFVFWRRRPPGRIVHLLGIAGSTLIAGGDHLWAIDVETGRPRWRFGYDDATAFGYGRGAVIGDRIFWPTREDLFAIDVATGAAVRRVRLRESLGVSGGHVIVSDDRLLIAGPDHLTAFKLSETAADEAQRSGAEPKPAENLLK